MRRSNAIMVLEDEALIALDIQMTLESAGLGPIATVSDSAAALAYLQDRAPRLAVVDVNLGDGGTSVAVALRLRALGAPFLFLTGYARAAAPFPDALDGIERLSKPFLSETLVAKIKALTQKPISDR